MTNDVHSNTLYNHFFRPRLISKYCKAAADVRACANDLTSNPWSNFKCMVYLVIIVVFYDVQLN